MRRLVCLCCTAVLMGCGGTDEQPDAAADSLSAAPTMAPAAATIALTDLTGTWNVQVMPETSDSVVLTYTFNATADTSTWTIKFPDRADPIPVHVVSVMGDSVMTHAGPYSSALRKGVSVTSDGVMRIQGGMLMGTTTAHYSVGPDSVRVFRTHGTKQ